ncbi:glycosyltransferase family 2 protein [Methanosarcina mazei]|uniref:Putative glycosyl transferase n=1 Tax=Methanosarcina mazei WWM610 TaxID=1434117 RepID=A0A0E3PSE7_METMZ|nr:glycosyltransferase family A protein [Methanosarcina mazei]AKB39127.1 putative glycosyl transferase [Methanosarcina mazei WWM610]
MPLVSVVIPLYNKEPHIGQALNSVLNQTFQEFEVIIIDDGSTDKSAEIVKNFTDSRIRLIQQENAGVSAARNRGIEEAKADLVAFLDADDEWTPSFLATILGLRNKYPEAGAYATAYINCYHDEKFIKPRYHFIPESPWEGLLPNYFRSVAFGDMLVSTSAVCIPKDKLLEFGGFLEGVWRWEDSDLWGKIALRYPIAFNSKNESIYHKESINRASKKVSPIIEHPFIETAKKAIHDKLVAQYMEEDLKEYIARCQIVSATANIFGGNPRYARRILKDCKTKYFSKRRAILFICAFIPKQFTYYLIKIGLFVKGIYRQKFARIPGL